MRDEGLDLAIRAAGGVGALARTLGISQPSVSNWSRIPAERVLAVETVTGVSRSLLRPDLYPQGGGEAHDAIDEIDLLRAREYDLLAHLLGKAPVAETLEALRGLKGDSSPLGMAHLQLADAARTTTPEAASREFFDLFIGLGRGELLPYASFYLTGFLHERPLAAVRADLKSLGLEREDGLKDPEDHIAILCDVMAGLAGRRFDAEESAERGFFERHLKPWAPRFFADLEIAPSSRLYKAVGAVGRTFFDIEAEAFEIGE
ncbi:Cro/CI family transcriptional regulator [Salinarimonas ramus]|uniref:Molecular chaperone n=1 Tax=Salinarimonas ramus TaxID=690164 RepID=A0A917V6P5_9HYPH|nr:Cro/CI family transcriptional regulator [Salinarimonas ramus]GGK45180.1 molecular chaperone [Salinarimonas ramus]